MKQNAKHESYQQNLQQLLFTGNDGFQQPFQQLQEPLVSVPDLQHQPQIMYSSSSAPPGFDRPIRSPPPGFEDEALSKLADLGFGSSITIAKDSQGGASNNQKPAAMYVSSRSGYKLRL